MSRQKLKIDQLIVPAGTPDGYTPAVTAGELVLADLSAGGGVAVTAWTDLVLVAGFITNATAFGNTPQYRRVGDVVELRGMIKRTAGNFATNVRTLISTLPAGFRPIPMAGTAAAANPATIVCAFPCIASVGNAARWDVYANGGLEVTVYGSTSWLPLDSVIFSSVA